MNPVATFLPVNRRSDAALRIRARAEDCSGLTHIGWWGYRAATNSTACPVAAKVNIDYRVVVDHHYCGVPHHLIHQPLDVRLPFQREKSPCQIERIMGHDGDTKP